MPPKGWRKHPQPEPFPKKRDESDTTEPPGFLRLKIPLREDGTPDLSQWDIRDSRKGKVRSLISNPEFLQKISGEPSSASTPSVEPPRGTDDSGAGTSVPTLVPDNFVTASECEGLFDVYSGIMGVAFCGALKAPWEMVWPIVQFDDAQKKAMAEPLAKIITRYIPPEWLLYAPEFQLGMMLVTATTMKFNEVKRILSEQQTQQAKNPKKEPVNIDATRTTTAAN